MKFSALARTYDRVAAAPREPERAKLLAQVCKRAARPTLSAVAHFTLGEVVEPQFSDKLGIGPATIRAAIASIAKRTSEEIDDEVKETGDMSAIVARYAKGRDTLTVADLWQRMERAVKREEDRLQLVKYIFQHTTANGAKYFTRMLLNQMRIGAGLGTLARAIAAAFAVETEAVEHAYAMTNDIGLTAVRARQGAKRLAQTGLAVFRPYQFMNAHKVDDPGEILAEFADKRIIFEIKYDGARLQIHLKRGRPHEIKFYSRRLNDDTQAMPDLVAALQ